ncbi:MAG TPA: hypothetical protein VJK26_02170 [Patescibacteria group bacterium]|nr:hypothetical protein [Patescibacteria group bacterium]
MMKSRFYPQILAGILIFALAVSLVGVVAAKENDNENGNNGNGNNDHKIRICHRTRAVTNPYVSIRVDRDAVDGDTGNDHGRGDHSVEHTGPVFNTDMQQGDRWGDIIPPDGVPGLNWTTEGQAIWNNRCRVPGPEPTPRHSPRVSPSPSISPSPEVSPSPTPTATSTSVSEPKASPSVSPQILGTTAPTPSPSVSPQIGGAVEELPTTGANMGLLNFSLLMLAALGVSFYLKAAGWKLLEKRLGR